MKKERTVRLGEYEHFKGKRYRVLSVARHSETLEEFVVYEALYKNKLWSNGHFSSLFSVESLLQSSSFSPRFFPDARLTNFSIDSNTHQAS